MIPRASKTILTCAVTGAITDPNSTPYLPITTDEIAESALAAADAGAAIVHIHVRDPETKQASMKIEYYADVVARVKKHNKDVLINLTTGPGAVFVPGTKGVLSWEKGPAISCLQKKECNI